MAYSREPLSGSTHGRGIKVVATATAGTTIHTGQASTTLTDVVTLVASEGAKWGPVVKASGFVAER